jgi:hypothetical protein
MCACVRVLLNAIQSFWTRYQGDEEKNTLKKYFDVLAPVKTIVQRRRETRPRRNNVLHLLDENRENERNPSAATPPSRRDVNDVCSYFIYERSVSRDIRIKRARRPETT